MGSPTTDERPVSAGPDGSRHPIPGPDERAKRLEAIRDRARRTGERGRTVVGVQGLGFVGTAVCAALASARDDDGEPEHFVVGVDLPTPDAYWKIARLREGRPPAEAPDPDLGAALKEAASRGNLAATAEPEAYELCDVVVVDVPLGVEDASVADPREIRLAAEPFEEAIRSVGRHVREDALVLVETTVPPGFTEAVIVPWLREERSRRGIEGDPLVAHAAERVMPGSDYLASIREYWRSFSGLDERSAERARAFLSTFVDTDAYPLWEHEDPTASEMTKVLENAYRATNIAFVHEWTKLAERSGVNLFEVVDAIRVREGTHDNMRYPGLGVGGYCLPKDALLAQWSARELFDGDTELSMSLDALRRNRRMPEHTVDRTREAADGLEGREVAVLGVAYRPDVPDTRNSPSQTLVEGLEAAGAHPLVHDPVVETWPERPDLDVRGDLDAVLAEADGAVLAVAHAAYDELTAEDLAEALGAGAFLVDAFDVVDDETAARLTEAGLRVAGVGKGHWRKRGYHE